MMVCHLFLARGRHGSQRPGWCSGSNGCRCHRTAPSTLAAGAMRRCCRMQLVFTGLNTCTICFLFDDHWPADSACTVLVLVMGGGVRSTQHVLACASGWRRKAAGPRRSSLKGLELAFPPHTKHPSTWCCRHCCALFWHDARLGRGWAQSQVPAAPAAGTRDCAPACVWSGLCIGTLLCKAA